MSGQFAQCTACGVTILFMPTERGKRMPLDPQPNPLGTVVFSKLVDGREVARILTPSNVEDFQGHTRYMSHFATCPKWKRRD